MELTDKIALGLLEKANSADLDFRIYDMTEEDRDGRTDIEVLSDEVDWMLYLYDEADGEYNYDLKEARSLIRKTNDGKTIPISSETFRPLPGYTPQDIENARQIIAEVKRLRTVAKALRKLGY